MKAINKLYQAIYDTSIIKVANHTYTHVCVFVCVPKENEYQIIVKKQT